MPELSRRALLTATGAAAAASLLPPNLARAAAGTPEPGPSDDIEHVVVLMQENRSFDHYFGTMPGVRGFDDPDIARLPNGRSVLYQPDRRNPQGYLLPFHLDTKATNAQAVPSTGHAWRVQHDAVNGGRMDRWLPAHREADGERNGPYTMGYYTKADIPFHWALAQSFTLCDNYFSSVLGPTWPNRLYHWTGTIDPNGTGGGPVISNMVREPWTWKTYPERLAEAGVSWHVYQQEDDYGCNPLEFFAAFQDAKPGSQLHEHGLTISPADRFAEDARNDRLPTVSWIVPSSPQSEHPDYTPASGADFLAEQLDAVAANPKVWNKTVFIVNYDENDGLFDHVVPPRPPHGTADEFVGGEPIGAGVRVPCLIVSPWSRGGHVARERFDHTSVLRFLERITGVTETNISAWRRASFGDLTSALGHGPHRPFPRLPETKRRLWQAEHDIATKPDPRVPGGDQRAPHQRPGRAGARPRAGAGTALAGARKHPTSRLVESVTTHRADFPHGFGATGFPGVLAAARGKPATAHDTAYVTGIVNSTVSVIDTATGRLDGGGIDAGANPYGIAKVGANTLYVTNSGASDVSVVDTSSNELTRSITVGLCPHGIACGHGAAYVANTGPDTGTGGSRTVSVIDTGSHRVTATLHVGLAPHGLALCPQRNALYVTCFDGVSVVDTETGGLRAHLRGQARATGLAAHPDGRTVYVVNTWQNAVSVLDTRTNEVRARIPVGRTPWQVALSPDGGSAYVTNANDDTVSVIDTGRDAVTGTVPVGHIPTGITAGTDLVWLTTNAASTVTAIDPGRGEVVATVPLGLSAEPAGIELVSR